MMGNKAFSGTHILSADQFDKNDLAMIFDKAREMREFVRTGGSDLLRGKILAALFFEPSTRTFTSFVAAMQRLGGNVIQINKVEDSSIAKGESLEDTVRSVAACADAIALRVPERGFPTRVAEIIHDVPLINAGDGDGEHPTQALLDLFTIQEELGRLERIHVTLVGDLKYGRTIHALVQLLMLFNARLSLVSPRELALPERYLSSLQRRRIPFVMKEELEGDALRKADVIYVTRVQKERFSHQAEYDRLKHRYCITLETMSHAQKDMVLMHPLPRVHEISSDVDQDPRAAYFRQVRNGLYVRMALLALILGKS